MVVAKSGWPLQVKEDALDQREETPQVQMRLFIIYIAAIRII